MPSSQGQVPTEGTLSVGSTTALSSEDSQGFCPGTLESPDHVFQLVFSQLGESPVAASGLVSPVCL